MVETPAFRSGRGAFGRAVLLTGALAGMLFAHPAAAQDPNLKRWESLPPAARERLREIYRRLEKLPPEERDQLLERLRGMSPEERQRAIDRARERVRSAGGPEGKPRPRPAARHPLLQHLPPAERRRILELPPQERPREIERVIDGFVERAARKLPPPLRERVKRFTRQEQVEFLRAWHESGILLRAFPDPREEAALIDLKPAERRALVRPESSKPEAVSAESWGRWRKLKPREQEQVLRRLERLQAERERSGRAEGAARRGPEAAEPARKID